MPDRLGWLGDALQDWKFASRLLWKAPLFSALLVLTLGLGIGANTAIFSFLSALVLRPLPYPEPDRIVVYQRAILANGERTTTADPVRFGWFRDHARSYEAVACMFAPRRMNVASDTGAVSIRGGRVSKDFFRVLGSEPAIGRTFTSPEDSPNGPRVAMLSYRLWQQLFDSDRQAVGKAVRIAGTAYEVAGIMPENFVAYPPADLWLPLRSTGRGNDWNYTVMGRLRPGVTLAQADTEAQALIESLRRSMPGEVIRAERGGVARYQDSLGATYRRPVLLILAAAGIVLLITCLNVANLLLARALGRTKELVIRNALGAGTERVIRQMLAESALIALLGGICATGFGWLGMAVLRRWLPRSISIFQMPQLDLDTLLFTAALAFATGLVFGIAPARQAARRNMADALKELAGHTTLNRGALKRRQALVAAQTALCVILLVAAGLSIRTFLKLRAVDPGFDPALLETASMNLNQDRSSQTSLMAYLDQALTRVRAIPGVESAAVTSQLPVDGQFNLPVIVPQSANSQVQAQQWRYQTTDYFRTLGVRVIRGRDFEQGDSGAAMPVAIVNAAFVRRFFSGQEAIGKKVEVPMARPAPQWTIVGIAPDLKETGLDEAAPPVVYVPAAQATDAVIRGIAGFAPIHWVIRMRGGATGVERIVEREAGAIDPTQPFQPFRPMTEIVADQAQVERFIMLLVSIFGGLALALAATGLYGTLSYLVQQRTHEIGIRLALGADSRSVVYSVVRSGMAVVVCGVIAGLVACAWLTRVLESYLFAISRLDAPTFAGVTGLLLATGLIACAAPAWRAARVDPMISLRAE